MQSAEGMILAFIKSLRSREGEIETEREKELKKKRRCTDTRVGEKEFLRSRRILSTYEWGASVHKDFYVQVYKHQE